MIESGFYLKESDMGSGRPCSAFFLPVSPEWKNSNPSDLEDEKASFDKLKLRMKTRMLEEIDDFLDMVIDFLFGDSK